MLALSRNENGEPVRLPWSSERFNRPGNHARPSGSGEEFVGWLGQDVKMGHRKKFRTKFREGKQGILIPFGAESQKWPKIDNDLRRVSKKL
ncbi:hypothetical protein E5288_WYG015898 [Bos mutus]|uniref:Uncharacterized protein n=1 Tax=Bos mutus TaxID=72004 RepID=A0A6B0RGL5_9CETA|nr:hypothetical protein [Bos mutus]